MWYRWIPIAYRSRLSLDRSRVYQRSLFAFPSSDGSFRVCPLPPLQPSHKRQSPLARLSRWLRKSLWCAAFLALASALAWGWFAIAAMTGTMTAVGADSLLTVLRETSSAAPHCLSIRAPVQFIGEPLGSIVEGRRRVRVRHCMLEQNRFEPLLHRWISRGPAALLPAKVQFRVVSIHLRGPLNRYPATVSSKRTVFRCIGGQLMHDQSQALRDAGL